MVKDEEKVQGATTRATGAKGAKKSARKSKGRQGQEARHTGQDRRPGTRPERP